MLSTSIPSHIVESSCNKFTNEFQVDKSNGYLLNLNLICYFGSRVFCFCFFCLLFSSSSITFPWPLWHQFLLDFLLPFWLIIYSFSPISFTRFRTWILGLFSHCPTVILFMPAALIFTQMSLIPKIVSSTQTPPKLQISISSYLINILSWKSHRHLDFKYPNSNLYVCSGTRFSIYISLNCEQYQQKFEHYPRLLITHHLLHSFGHQIH